MKRPDDHTHQQQEKLLQDILNQTSGSACERALDLVPRLATDEMEGMDRSLLLGHLEHCAGCRAVAVVLGWLEAELPAMAEVDPGPQFTTAVLTRTAKLPSRAAAQGQPGGAAGLMDRWGRWWEQRIQRQLFVWQAAYALTVVLVGLMALPPLRGVPSQALTAVQANSFSLPIVDQVFSEVGRRIDGGSEQLVWLISQECSSSWQRMSGDVEQRIDRTAVDRADLGSHLHGMWQEARLGRLGPASVEMLAAGREFKDLWRHWWRLEIQSTTGTFERRPS